MKFTGSKVIKKCSVLMTVILVACSGQTPEAISFAKDHCESCKMTIVDPRFGAELVTSKGKKYKFDTIECLLEFQKKNQIKNVQIYVQSSEDKKKLIPVSDAAFRIDPHLQSPMGKAILVRERSNSTDSSQKMLTWQELLKILYN